MWQYSASHSEKSYKLTKLQWSQSCTFLLFTGEWENGHWHVCVQICSSKRSKPKCQWGSRDKRM